MGAPAAVTLSRGRRIDLSRPDYYQDLLTGIVEEILHELAELEKINLESLGRGGLRPGGEHHPDPPAQRTLLLPGAIADRRDGAST